MSKLVRAAIAHDLKEINVQHLFIVKLSAIDSHQNHYTGPRISSAETLTDVCAHHFWRFPANMVLTVLNLQIHTELIQVNVGFHVFPLVQLYLCFRCHLCRILHCVSFFAIITDWCLTAAWHDTWFWKVSGHGRRNDAALLLFKLLITESFDSGKECRVLSVLSWIWHASFPLC